MIRISDEQVAQAEARAAQQEQVRDDAARALEGNPLSELKALKHTEETRRAAQLRASARELRAAYDRQVEEEMRRVSRPELEKAAASEIRLAEQEMGARRKALTEAAVAAQAALVALVDAGVSYNEGLTAHVRVLAKAGLDFGGGDSGGTRSILNVDRLKVKGQEYHPLDPGSAAVWVLRRVVEARLSRHHPMVPGLEWTWRSVNASHPEFEQRVPSPPVKSFPEPPRMRMPSAG
ncbi:hypothetical protein NFX46_26640 [Streptomyces phaeoluteigriseus]|uniref:Uncharacterized protein n=1 Tax=Streptomyces phaeoluteigriseus TaxID=114686 RepID=A0ABY4ZD78_9ACTN|nr:hypothetical protein [Streptomyces phaeoluteigriseus]USQ86977.1 hypothetical protein NFX46_26640 [Streptomyces phaeoluteigriseus]